MDLIELTEFIIKSIVTDEESVSVKEFPTEDENTILIQVMVADEDMGRVSVKAAKDIKVRNDMGETEINKVYSRVDIDASMGSVDIDELNLDQNSNIEASMGSINISKTNNIYIDASADMGSVNVAKNNRESKVELKIRCSMGSVNVGD